MESGTQVPELGSSPRPSTHFIDQMGISFTSSFGTNSLKGYINPFRLQILHRYRPHTSSFYHRVCRTIVGSFGTGYKLKDIWILRLQIPHHSIVCVLPFHTSSLSDYRWNGLNLRIYEPFSCKFRITIVHILLLFTITWFFECRVTMRLSTNLLWMSSSSL